MRSTAIFCSSDDFTEKSSIPRKASSERCLRQSVARRGGCSFTSRRKRATRTTTSTPRPKGGEVHRMMISQTGEGKP
nr:MAG TPA: hypothetical protein [Bacteriophage sp.]